MTEPGVSGDKTEQPAGVAPVPDVTVSIINTNNRQMTLDCLRSVFANTHRVRLEVFVVDNACTDGSAEAIQAEFPQVRLIRNEHRLGFSTNNNMVFRQAQGRYLLMLNDDTLVQPGALDGMVEFMDAHPRAGVVGARLLNPDGSNQPAFADFPGPGDFLQPLLTRLQPNKWDVAAPIRVDSVCGACMMVRRQVAESVGVLDTEFDPLYVEEREWCFRIHQQGWDIYHLPSARVIHFGGQTSKRTSEIMTRHVYMHRLLFCRKHYSKSRVFVYQLFLSTVALLKTLAWGLRALLTAGERRAKAIERMRCHSTLIGGAWLQGSRRTGS
jgi:N-acetylglucosaminyl-diphospho-decaprenol L-rhamnosyltransferase